MLDGEECEAPRWALQRIGSWEQVGTEPSEDYIVVIKSWRDSSSISWTLASSLVYKKQYYYLILIAEESYGDPH